MSSVALAAGPTGTDTGESVLTTSAEEKYTLRHQLSPNQTIRYKVTHVAKTKTRMNGTEEIANVHTTSVRSWKVRDADGEKMTFDHQIDSVEMTQQNGDKPEIRWSSLAGEKPPAAFSVVAEQIGTPLATVTIDGKGTELNRESHAGSKSSLGMGSLTLTLPAEPVAVGESWTVPSEIQARLDDGQVKTIKIRQVYTLKKVKAGVATIAIKSQTLTPIDEESLRAQIVQQLSNGSVRFDVDNGYLLGKELDWDETVVGFQGAGSMMEYRARMTEELVNEDTVKSAASSSNSRR
nr:DUF6263 family protein [Aporhodopirellula aestuarii]